MVVNIKIVKTANFYIASRLKRQSGQSRYKKFFQKSEKFILFVNKKLFSYTDRTHIFQNPNFQRESSNQYMFLKRDSIHCWWTISRE